MSGSFQTRDREKLWNMTLVGLRVSVDIWTRRTAVIWGLHSIRGTPKPADPFACVRLFMQGFEVVLLNASFGCIGKLFFNLAWQAYGLGFALHIPLVQHWCLRLRPLKPGVLFKTPLITEELRLLVVNQRAESPHPLLRSTWKGAPGRRICTPWIAHTDSLLIAMRLQLHLFSRKINTHTHICTLTPTFCPVDSPFPPRCVTAPLLSSFCTSTPHISPLFPSLGLLAARTWLLTL